ncbi:hypothetical protein [Streptomyces sp. XD-27]|uniref:hypothetical protein n=1 Tax=Streptomyces sp. XD-27 TaxID=3062779 RepID=UPI0026F47569|nr:hypothetical protein [Streptomyces sp. XD-27]WKX72375.1 hypothetical protein Q3Y56_22915 [Streptomyces sp. XD-27]
MTPRKAGTVWLKKHWNLRHNPFPSTGIARLGGSDPRENGLLYEPDVNADTLQEAIDKFVLGTAFSGLKFGYLWSTDGGHGGHGGSDARGFGKSVLMQHLTGILNTDFGCTAYAASGLDEEDAAEAPICGLLTSFDTAQIRSLNAALFSAVEYATDFRVNGDDLSLAQRLRAALVERVGSDDVATLVKVVADVHRSLRGRTLGPPDGKLIEALCSEDAWQAADYLDQVKPASRTRNGAVYLASFLLFASAAGMRHVLLCCDQLEDLASKTTARSKRDLEIERFRDIILETLPMADMLSVVVTMHPRAALTIGTAWDLADLPTFEITETNKHRTVVLPGLRSVEAATKLVETYLGAAVKHGADREPGDLAPFTKEAVAALFSRSSRKPRDVLRKANGLVEAASADNLDVIDEAAVDRYLDALGPDFEDGSVPGTAGGAASLDWSQG